MAYGKCSPDGRSLRLGGNTSVFFRVVFSCIFQCPAFPRWSFYTARGEHLWFVFLEMLCQSYCKQTLVAYGPCSPDGFSFRLGGGTLLYCLNRFSYIFQCPRVPLMVVLRTKGGTSMVCFFGDVMPQLKRTNLEKDMFSC